MPGRPYASRSADEHATTWVVVFIVGAVLLIGMVIWAATDDAIEG
jgi:hypothetical protein